MGYYLNLSDILHMKQFSFTVESVDIKIYTENSIT